MKTIMLALSTILLIGCQANAPKPAPPEENSNTSTIKKALIKELNTDQNISVTILEEAGNHVRGKITIAGEPAGGLFLAAQTEQGWEIPYHGNGVIDCEAIIRYQFPPTLAPECTLSEPEYTLTSMTEEICQKDSDCELPARYAVRSICPYQTRCLQNQCTVICPIPDAQAPAEEPASEKGSAQFSGKLESVHTGCFADGECYVVVDGKHVTAIRGWAQETVGSVKGIEGFGDLSNHIGETIDVYAKDSGNGKYTLYGDAEYYIWLK